MATGEMLEKRGSKYGPFPGNAALSQALKNCCRTHKGGKALDEWAPFQIEALEMMLLKVSRLVNGDQNYADSWADIIGYTQLVLDIMKHGCDVRFRSTEAPYSVDADGTVAHDAPGGFKVVEVNPKTPQPERRAVRLITLSEAQFQELMTSAYDTTLEYWKHYCRRNENELDLRDAALLEMFSWFGNIREKLSEKRVGE